MLTCVTVTVDDKLQPIQRWELSSIVIKIHGCC